MAAGGRSRHQAQSSHLLGRHASLCLHRPGRGTSLYSVQQGQGGPAKLLGKEENHVIVNLAFSPDGRYVLYSADGPR